jgi:autophagy-related protein 17
MDDLDDLGQTMSEMLERLHAVEVCLGVPSIAFHIKLVVQIESEAQLLSLHDYLYTLENLQARFGAYQHAYNRLLIEMDRRRHFQQASERIINTMMDELDALALGEKKPLNFLNHRVDSLISQRSVDCANLSS